MTDETSPAAPPVATPRSPDILSAAPPRAAGIRRLNSLPLVLTGIVIVISMGLAMHGLNQRSAAKREAELAALPIGVGGRPAVLDDAPEEGAIDAAARPPAPKPTPITPPKLSPPAEAAPKGRFASEWETYRQRQAQADAARFQAEQDAIRSASAVRVQQQSPRTGQPEATGGAQTRTAMPNPAGSQITPPRGDLAALGVAGGDAEQGAAAGGGGLFGGMVGTSEAARADPNAQRAKLAFFEASPGAPGSIEDEYLPAFRRRPISAYEVKAGTVIPATLVSGIKSDLPGQIIAQVRENVYDTATGKHVLIPQGAKLVGVSSNTVTYGQEVVATAWTRVIYPDASSLNLGQMPGADAEGYSGLHDRVNNHYWKVFGQALMLSVFSAGVQLSQPRSTGTGGIDSSQIIAAALGMQLGQLGMQLARRGLDIQPTVEVRNGGKFNVMVTKDIIIEPWKRG